MVDCCTVFNVSNDPSEWNLSSSAGQDIGTGTNHVFSPGELLAVEDEGISVFSEASFAGSALFLQSLETISLVINLFVVGIDGPVVILDATIISINITIIVFNAVLKVVDIVI